MSFLFGGGSTAKPSPAPVVPTPRTASASAQALSTAALTAAGQSGYASTVGSSGLGDTSNRLTSTAKLLGLSFGSA